MTKTNLLDLNNDILNIIGEYVNQDNIKEHRKREKEFIFKGLDNSTELLMKTNDFDSNYINKLLYNMINDGV